MNSELVMSQRLDKSWVVFRSIENNDHDRCVDLFIRPDGTFGFEEFRRDVEDQGRWTPVSYYSGSTFTTEAGAINAARDAAPWFAQKVATPI